MRSRWARAAARATSSTTVAALRTRSTPAPSARAAPSTSMVWLTWRPRAVSPTTSSSGVRSLTASVSAVNVFVKPGPWCAVARPSPCVACA